MSGDPRSPDQAPQLIGQVSRLNSKNYANYLEPMQD
jgi:hypothetical protein